MIAAVLLLVMLIFILALGATAFVHILFFVPYVPSRYRVVRHMIKAAKLKPRETVYDLGSGDGRILTEAEKKASVDAVGFEIAPLPYIASKIRLFLTRSRARIFFRNFFNTSLKSADVIFCYLFPHVMPDLAKKIKKECRKGTRIISNTFHIPGLKLVRTLRKNPSKGLPTVYVYKI